MGVGAVVAASVASGAVASALSEAWEQLIPGYGRPAAGAPHSLW
jgi:hypothetical protein